MKKWLGVTGSILAMYALAHGHARAAGIQQAFLIQNSGWMEPFYTDPQSQFKPLVTAVVQSVAAADDPLFLLAFSQSNGANVSPKLLSEQSGKADVSRQLTALGIAHKGTGTTLADTDFQEAVTKTITGPFKSTPGIIWIFTNNKNSPGNDPATAARNSDFYRLLHLEPSITKTLVFPLKMPVKGRLYKAQGMMVYALAYGEPAARALDRILKAGQLASVLTRPPARLKPLDIDGLRIVPESVRNMPGVHVSLGADQRTLVFDVAAGKLVPTVVLLASLQNLFFPYVIQHADLGATLAVAGRTLPVRISPAAVVDLQPGQRQAVEVQFALPMEKVPSAWSVQALAAMGKQVIVPMTVSLGLNGQQLTLADDYKKELTTLFPGDPISGIFTAPSSVRTSEALVPVILRIQYPLLPVLLVMGTVLGVVGSIAALALVSGRSTRYPVAVDDLHRHVMLKPFASIEIKDESGQPVGTIKRGLGRPKVVSVAEGHTLHLQ